MFAKRLSQLRAEKGLTQDEVAEVLGCKRTTICNYETGYSEPRMIELIRLAELFDVSIDYLTGYTKTKQIENEELTSAEKELLHDFAQLSQIDQEKIIAITKTFVKVKK